MQQTLRPYLTAGTAIVGVSLIALIPASPHSPESPVHQHKAVTLTAADPITPYLDLITNTVNNLGALIGNTLQFPILSQLLNDPLGSLQNLPNVISLLLTFLPDINIDAAGLPAGISGDIPPLLFLTVGALSPLVTVGNALFGVTADVLNVLNDPLGAISALLGSPAILANAFLNAQDGIGIVGLTLPVFNGILVPGQSLDTLVDVGQLADNVGLGDQTLSGLADQFGLGDQQLATIAISLFDALGLGDQTPVDLANAVGLGGMQVTDVATAVLNALGIGQLTPAGLVEQLGGGDQTVAGVVTNVLDALGLGDQNAIQLLDATSLGTATVGGALAGLLGGLGQSDLTVGQFVTELGLADLSVQDIGNATQLTNTSVGSILSNLGFNLNLNNLISSTGGDTTGINAQLVSLMPNLNDMTLASILAGQGLQPDTTVLDILSMPPADGGTPLADQTLSAVLEQNQTTFSDLLTNAGLGTSDLDTVVNQLLGTTTVATLLSGLGLDAESISTVVSNLPTDTTVSDLLSTLPWGTTDLDTLATSLLGSTTVDSLLTDLGLTNTIIDDVLTQLGVAGIQVLNTDIGDFFGIVPALLNGLPEQIAQALGA